MSRRPRLGRAIASLLTTIALLSAHILAGCAPIERRLAMGRVQRRYVALADRVEADLPGESRVAAAELRRALEDPAITASASYERDESFRTLHRQALDAVESFERQAATADAVRRSALLGGISSACRSCHDRFRG